MTEALIEDAKILINASKSDATKKAFASDWASFEAWAISGGHQHLPASPHTVILYLTHLHQAGRKISTIRRRVATISQAHQHAGHESPTRDRHVRALLQGIARSAPVPVTKKKALGVGEIRAMVAACDLSTLKGLRDRAVLLCGFASAMRRGELVSLDFGDVEFQHDAGVILRLRKSKTDQQGIGRSIGIPLGKHPQTCSVMALKTWLESASINDGPIFRPISRHGHVRIQRLSPHAVAGIVKEAAKAANLNPQHYSGHSLRSGFATSASRALAPEAAIQRQTGHRSIRMLREYVQEGNVFQENAVRYLDL